MALAKKADKTYIDVEVSFGVLRVYHVPDAMLLSVGPDRPEPELPVIRMKTATGSQDRPAKPGDEQYEAWQQDKAAYDDENYQLRIAIGSVASLRDIDWSEVELDKIPPNKGAMEMYNSNWPKNELLRKKAWLDWTILFKRSDQNAILEAMSIMSGESEPTDEMIEEVKKSSGSSSKSNQEA